MALERTEMLTHLPPEGVADAVIEHTGAVFLEKELAEPFVVMAINAWNRVSVAFKTVPSSAKRTAWTRHH